MRDSAAYELGRRHGTSLRKQADIPTWLGQLLLSGTRGTGHIRSAVRRFQMSGRNPSRMPWAHTPVRPALKFGKSTIAEPGKGIRLKVKDQPDVTLAGLLGQDEEAGIAGKRALRMMALGALPVGALGYMMGSGSQPPSSQMTPAYQMPMPRYARPDEPPTIFTGIQAV